MNYSEAIEQLKFDMAMILFNSYTTCELTDEEVALENIRLQNSDNYKSYLADRLAIVALEKEIPEKPKLNYKTTWLKRFLGYKSMDNYTCPRCGNARLERLAISASETYYCWNCGKRLDWDTKEQEGNGNGAE